MSYSTLNLSAKEAFLQPKRLVSYLRTIHRSQDDGGEREHLVAGEDRAPQSLRHPVPLPLLQFEAKSSCSPDLDGICLSQRHAQIAQGILLSLLCCRLGPGDVILVSGCPVGGGGFADVYDATHNGRKVVLKSYHRYVSFNIAQVATVCRNYVPELTADSSLVEIPK